MRSAARRFVSDTELSVELPGLLGEFAQRFGIDLALQLTTWRGGIRLFVPRAPIAADHEITKRLGLEAANWLAQRIDGDYINVPRCVAYLRRLRDNEIRELGQTTTAAALALRYNLDERQIWRILANAPAEGGGQQQLL